MRYPTSDLDTSFLLTPPFFLLPPGHSLSYNDLREVGGTAIAAALRENKTLQSIKWVTATRPRARSKLVSDLDTAH